jgi:hypothetical protein
MTDILPRKKLESRDIAWGAASHRGAPTLQMPQALTIGNSKARISQSHVFMVPKCGMGMMLIILT